MAAKTDPSFKWSEYDEDTGLSQCLACKHVYNGQIPDYEFYCPNCDHFQGLEKDRPKE